MILTCPKCATRYQVAGAVLGKAGRTVRCARCKHRWFEAPPSASEPPVVPPSEAARSAVRPSNHGEGRSQRRLERAASLLAIVMLGAALVMFRPTILAYVPILEGAYASLGMYATHGVVLAGVSVEKLPAERRDRYVLRGHLLNESGQALRAPTLRIQVIDVHGNVLQTEDFPDTRSLAPGADLPLDEIALETRFRKSSHLVMEIGSPLELTLRR